MDTQKLANILFQSKKIQPIGHWFDRYPKRQLPPTAEVTRLCPSPTGFLHLGALYMGVICRRIATDSGGVFYLRIEDTDTDREVPGARSLIVQGLSRFGLVFDEGFVDGETQFGNYGPYLQTQRSEMYESFAYELVVRGHAYPCFMTKDELHAQRAEQESHKVRPGYYGPYALWRNASFEQIQEKILAGTPYVVRLKSSGDQNARRFFHDEFLGDMHVPYNDEDFVLLKTNGIPTYHFAHVIDDYLMGTTFVIRANEWLPSVGKHLELWELFGFPVPKYGHLTPINKREGSTIRKLSKRKDPEANIMRYVELGYPPDTLIGYLYRLANPSFDDWWQQQRRGSVWDFPFSIHELQKDGPGPLVDLKKIDDISSDIIAFMSAAEVADQMIAWAQIYDPSFARVITQDRAYVENILAIERDGDNPRKDIKNWSLGRESIAYFFDSMFRPDEAKMALGEAKLDTIAKNISEALIGEISRDILFTTDSLDRWLVEMKTIAERLGFVVDKNKVSDGSIHSQGDFAQFMKIIRLGITGVNRTPNLFFIFQVMGKIRIVSRLQSVLNI